MKILFMCAALLASPDQFDSTQQQTQSREPSKWVGDIFFGLLPSYNIDDPLAPKVLVVELCGMGHMPTTSNYFGTKGYTRSCVYLPLTPQEADTMADNVKAWVKEPYISHFVYIKSIQ